MGIASLSGAMYGAGSANLLCMGLFWAGLSFYLSSIYRSLATCHSRLQFYQQPPTLPLSPPPPFPNAQQQINTVLRHHGNHLLMLSLAGGEI